MKLLELLQGKKVYCLMAVGALIALAQYGLHIDMHIPELPAAKNAGELAQEIYAFALGASVRSAVAN